MERWRIFGLTTLLAVLFLACLFLVAEGGRARMREAAEQMQHSMARRILLGELHEQVTAAVLGYQAFLLSGRPQHLEPLRDSAARINRTADALVASYAGEAPAAAAAARKLRYYAGVQAGTMATTMLLYSTSGPSAARDLARGYDSAANPVGLFLGVSAQLEGHESKRMRETRANWQRETVLVRQLALVATAANMLLVLSAMLMAHATLRRHREVMQQVERRRDELEVEAATRAAELNEVYGELQTVQEQERSRLARGLHDELGGLLLAARMDATWLLQHSSNADVRAQQLRLRRLVEALDQGIDLKRRVIEELRPTLLDNMGLVAAVRWQVNETCMRAGLHCACHFPDTEPVVDPQIAIALFRVVQEALANVVKHARAQSVDVTLDVCETHLLLVVADDGKGIDPTALRTPQAHGIAGMNHRMSAVGGTLQVTRAADGGTQVRALVPRHREAGGPA